MILVELHIVNFEANWCQSIPNNLYFNIYFLFFISQIKLWHNMQLLSSKDWLGRKSRWQSQIRMDLTLPHHENLCMKLFRHIKIKLMYTDISKWSAVTDVSRRFLNPSLHIVDKQVCHSQMWSIQWEVAHRSGWQLIGLYPCTSD